jgi:cytochrome P450
MSERDPDKHHQMRKFLSRAFSDTSLKEQETLINTKIDRFVERIGEQETVNFTHWFNLLTFGKTSKKLSVPCFINFKRFC